MNQSAGTDLSQVLTAVTDYGLWHSLITFYAPAGTTDALGQVDLTNLVPVAGLVDIECMDAPNILQRPVETYTNRGQLDISDRNVSHLLLNGYYPAAMAKMQAAVDGGELQEVMEAEPDTQRIMTRLALRRYSV